MGTLEQRIQRVVQEEVAIVAYDARWPEMFRKEKDHLLSCLPSDLIRRVEHFGSTAVPGLAAKPIVDMLVEVTDLPATRARIAPELQRQGYDYFWRPTHGDDGPPFYAWFIKRDPSTGARTHHVHMVEGHFVEHWDRLLFRDYLIEHSEAAKAYEALKLRLSSASPRDRAAYTQGKTEFVVNVTEQAKRYYGRAKRIAPPGRGRITGFVVHGLAIGPRRVSYCFRAAKKGRILAPMDLLPVSVSVEGTPSSGSARCLGMAFRLHGVGSRRTPGGRWWPARSRSGAAGASGRTSSCGGSAEQRRETPEEHRGRPSSPREQAQRPVG
jgi:GrpB-like predicted nucleotidyltransferase (UPF0157 family)